MTANTEIRLRVDAFQRHLVDGPLVQSLFLRRRLLGKFWVISKPRILPALAIGFDGGGASAVFVSFCSSARNLLGVWQLTLPARILHAHRRQHIARFFLNARQK